MFLSSPRPLAKLFSVFLSFTKENYVHIMEALCIDTLRLSLCKRKKRLIVCRTTLVKFLLKVVL